MLYRNAVLAVREVSRNRRLVDCGGLCACLLILSCVQPLAAAEPFIERFDARTISWTVQQPPAGLQLLSQQRISDAGRTGGAERLRFHSSQESVRLMCEHRLPAARALEEVTASAWVKSDRGGWVFALRVTVVGIVDPETKSALQFIVPSNPYTEPNRWQQLVCRLAGRELEQRLRLLRARYPGIPEGVELTVDQAILACQSQLGEFSVDIDDLEFGPIVPPSQGATSREFTKSEPGLPEVSLTLDRLLVGGQPFFPRIAIYHGESPAFLAEAGFNVVWVPDLGDTGLLRRLREHNLWVTATPPHAADETGDPLQANAAGLVPFTQDFDPVLFWMLGTRISSDKRDRVASWIEQIEFADRRRGRPIAADVSDGERNFSRDLPMLGISRHPLQTTVSFSDYRDGLMDRRSLARPGAFSWTWLQTEPVAAMKSIATDHDDGPCLEPEQLRLHAYAALAAGSRGVGYWSTERLDGEDPRTRERLLAIRQLNLELQLLEPWLAASGGSQRIGCQLKLGSQEDTTSRNLPFGGNLPNVLERNAQLRARETKLRQRQAWQEELTAAVFRGEMGILVLPMWLERYSQFVPAQSAASDVTLVIPGCSQAAEAVEITTTGLHRLDSQRVTGGLSVTLPRLDQTGIIWVTSDLAQVDRVRQRIARMQSPSAEVAVELARRKLDRTGIVDAKLLELGPAQPDSPQILGRAKLRLERSQNALRSGDFEAARVMAMESMQLLRILQRAHWDEAVRHLSSPASSPYTFSYQSLPEHWKLVADLGRGRARGTQNLLPSGEFEDFDTLIAEGWDHSQSIDNTLRASAELFPTGHKSRYSMRLACGLAAGVTEAPRVVEYPTVSVTTPSLAVRAGQIVHISGWVKVGAILGSRDGLLIHDTLLGRTGALRIRDAAQWTRFELIRRVPASCDMKVTLALSGLGEASIDDLQVVPHDVSGSGDTMPSERSAAIQQTSGTGLLDRLPKLPRFSPLPTRDE